MNHPKKVRLVEVGPRDGLQNEARPVPVDAKVALIDALSAAGHSAVEAGSFVSPKWVPQMANTDQVMARIRRKPGIGYPVLVPNKQGMNGAIEASCEEIAIFTAASGNVGTEDVIYLMNGLGIEHGVDLDAIAKAGREICAALGREPASKVAQALKAKAAA